MPNSKSLLIFCMLKRSVLPLELIKYITEMTIPTVSICPNGYIVNESLFEADGKTKHEFATCIASTIIGTFILCRGKIMIGKGKLLTCFSPHNKLQLFIEASGLSEVKSMFEVDWYMMGVLTKCGTLIVWNINRSPEIIDRNVERENRPTKMIDRNIERKN